MVTRRVSEEMTAASLTLFEVALLSAGGTECESLGRQSQVVVKMGENPWDLRPRLANDIAPRFKKGATSKSVSEAAVISSLTRRVTINSQPLSESV